MSLPSRVALWIFPFLLGGTFIEAQAPGEPAEPRSALDISLPFGRDFH